MPFALALTVAGGLAALYLSRGESHWPYALAKGVAAVGFVWVALAGGLQDATTPRLVVAGLVLAGVGDVALAFRQPAAFLSGMAAFALTHILFAVAFAAGGVSVVPLTVALIVVFAASSSAWRWLRPHLPSGLVAPILVYTTLGSLMVALAWSFYGAGGPIIAALGATGFYLSDLAVARERFVSRRVADKLWGLPLYYLGQTLIALSV